MSLLQLGPAVETDTPNLRRPRGLPRPAPPNRLSCPQEIRFQTFHKVRVLQAATHAPDHHRRKNVRTAACSPCNCPPRLPSFETPMHCGGRATHREKRGRILPSISAGSRCLQATRRTRNPSPVFFDPRRRVSIRFRANDWKFGFASRALADLLRSQVG